MAGPGGEGGVPDMTVISDIDEHGINRNLQKRYKNNKIYVSVVNHGLSPFPYFARKKWDSN